MGRQRNFPDFGEAIAVNVRVPADLLKQVDKRIQDLGREHGVVVSRSQLIVSILIRSLAGKRKAA